MRRLWGDLFVAFQYLKGVYKKTESDSLLNQIMTGQGGMVLKLNEGRFRLQVRRKILQLVDSEALEQAAERP